jgi:hypothetical protein
MRATLHNREWKMKNGEGAACTTKGAGYLTTGKRDSQITMSDIWSNILNFFSIVSWQHSSNLSAQSPPCQGFAVSVSGKRAVWGGAYLKEKHLSFTRKSEIRL